MIRIVVKGEQIEARAACNGRNIFPLKFERYTGLRNFSSIFLVDDEYEDKVVAWFCETTVLPIRGEGYPAGTCIWYQFIDSA